MRDVYAPTLKSIRSMKQDHCRIWDDYSAFLDHLQATPLERRKADSDKADKWHGNLSYDGALDKARNGDLSYAARTDKLLEKYENMLALETRQFRSVDAMCGGVPNVAAYLAGSPLNMRQRQRVTSQAAPVNVIVELGAASETTAEKLAERGAAVLAFVRAVSTSRPVNLYAAVSHSLIKGPDSATATLVRIDTAPLDLARAGFFLSAVAATRQLLFSANMAAGETTIADYLPFTFNNSSFHEQNLHRFWARFVDADMGETVIIPPLRDGFGASFNGETWLRGAIAKVAVQEAA